jgi:hypothetical protein
MPEDLQSGRFKRLFSLDEANSLVPMFTGIMVRVQKLHREVMEISGSKLELAKGNGRVIADIGQLSRDLEAVSVNAVKIRDELERITDAGAEVKDIETGLVDFPHERAGRIVYLCWRLGEDSIRWWHELDTGYAGRKPL